MKFVLFNLRSNWVDRSGIPDFRAADCGVVCFERTTQVNARIVQEESLVYRPVSHVVLGYLNCVPTSAGTTRCTWPKNMENLSLSLDGLYPVPKWSPQKIFGQSQKVRLESRLSCHLHGQRGVRHA